MPRSTADSKVDLAQPATPPRHHLAGQSQFGTLSGKIRRSRRTLEVIGLGLSLGLPVALSDPYSLRVMTLAYLFATLSVGLVVSLGHAGIFNMSQGSFYGIGAYATAILVTRMRMPFELAIPISMLFTAIVGAVVSLTALRIKGDYWALVSMAFTIGVEKVMEHWTSVTQGLDGYIGIPVVSLFGIELNSPLTFYYCTLGALVVSFVATRQLLTSFVGRAMRAVKFDEPAAQAMGIFPYGIKILAMAWSAAIASLAGSMLVVVAGYIFPTDFDLLPSFNITLFVIVGGITSLGGAVLATVFLTTVTEVYRPLTDYRFMILGVALLVAIFLRGGVFDSQIQFARRQLTNARQRLFA